MTDRIREFLRNRTEDGPVLVVDLDVVRDNYNTFAKALPDSRVFYAVKANPAPEVLSLLASLGSCFDTASVAEIEMALAAGASADRISYGNTIKKERDIARAFALGVRLFAVDCKAEVEKVARASSAASLPWPRTCLSTGTGWASKPTASRSMSVRSSATSMPGIVRWRRRRPCSGNVAIAGSTCRWSISAAASRPST